MTTAQHTIGVDLGGTRIRVAQVSQRGEILYKTRIATPSNDGAEAVTDAIIAAVRALQLTTAQPALGIGIGVAGQIDTAGETVRFAPNLRWQDLPLRATLQQRLGLPVVLLNDVRAATWAELRFGAGQGCRELLCLFIGTGIGGCLVSGGRIISGASNSAGELGHMSVALNGPLCRCGNHGCLEALAGGWAIARRANEAVAADPKSGAALIRLADRQPGAITSKMVAEAAHAGDKLAGQIIAEVSEALISGVVSLVNAFNPERLILGGGVIEGLPELIARIEQGVKKRALPAASEVLQVVPAKLQNDAGVIGAASFAWQRFGGNGGPG
jgi:glucokinase